MPKEYSDIGLCRRLVLEARPFWPHLAAIFLLSVSESVTEKKSLPSPKALAWRIGVTFLVGIRPS